MLLLKDVDKEHVPCLGLVFGREDAAEHRIAVFLFAAVAEAAVAADDKYYCHYSEQEHHPMTAEVHCRHDYTRTDKGYAGSEKPSANHRDYTGDAEHRAFAAPGTVGKRRTHCHHECYKCGRQRQFHGCTECYERSGKHKVDRTAYKVERRSLVHDGLIGIETPVEPRPDPRRGDASYPCNHTQRPSYQAARDT